MKKPTGLAPLTPMSVSDPFPTASAPPAPAATAAPTSEVPTRRSQAERDLHFLRQQLEQDSSRWKQLHTICLRANRALERNISDLRKQVDDLRTAAISNLAAGM